MDIVHLIETKINKSAEEETSSHTYAEIEQTLMLDHSEGVKSYNIFFLYFTQTSDLDFIKLVVELFNI